MRLFFLGFKILISFVLIFCPIYYIPKKTELKQPGQVFYTHYMYEKLCIYGLNKETYLYKYPGSRYSKTPVSALNCSLENYYFPPQITEDSTVVGFGMWKDNELVYPLKPWNLVTSLCFKKDTLSWIEIMEGLKVDYYNYNPYSDRILWQKVFASPDCIDPWLWACAQKLKKEGKIRWY
jgi:hypothetical protein